MDQPGAPAGRGPYEEEARQAAGLEDADRAADAPDSAPDGVDPAEAVGSPTVPNDVEGIHDDVPGFVDAVDSPAGPAKESADR